MEKKVLENQFKNTDNQKIGYIKINSTLGQITFSAYEKFGGILYKRPNIHKKNIKSHNIIHLNVKTDLFMKYSNQIKQHISMLLRVFLDLNIDDFELILHNFK